MKCTSTMITLWTSISREQGQEVSAGNCMAPSITWAPKTSKELSQKSMLRIWINPHFHWCQMTFLAPNQDFTIKIWPARTSLQRSRKHGWTLIICWARMKERWNSLAETRFSHVASSETKWKPQILIWNQVKHQWKSSLALETFSNILKCKVHSQTLGFQNKD